MTKDADKTKEQLINELTLLREKEHHWKLFSAATSNLLWNWNFEDDSVERNGHFETILGYSNDEVLPTITWWVEKLHPKDRDRVLATFQEALENGQNTCDYDYRFQKRDGAYAEIRDNVFILRDQKGVGIRALGAMTDITKIKRAEEALKKSEYLHRGAIIAATGIPFVRTFNPSKFDYVGEGIETLTGYTVEEFTIPTWESISKEIVPIGHLQGLSIPEILQKLLTGETDTWQIEYHIQTRHGQNKWIYSVGKAELSKNKESLQGHGVFFDITERKQLETQLKASQLYYKTIIETATDPIIIIDDQGIIETVNDATTKLFGHAKEALIGQNIKILMPEPYYTQHDDYLKNYHLTGKSNVIGVGREVMGLRKDQTTFPLHLSVAKINLDGIIKYTGVIRDISKEKKQEQDLVKLQRLHAISELSAGISHNLNNMLMAIMGPAQMLQLKTNDPDILEEVDDIMIGATRARDLVKRLHQATQSTVSIQSELEPVNIEPIIIETIQQTRPRWKDEAESKNIAIDISTDLTDVPPIKAIPSEISDIFVNLMFNAIDAMPAGGMITIKTETHEQDVLLTFSDTGIGMNEETKRRIFEPFYTTKQGIGTGLGLSTVYNSIHQWGGQIHVESDIGMGTTFRIYLPTESSPLEKAERQHNKVRQSGNVLVLDDDPIVRKTLLRMLSIHHTVDVFESGKSALEKLNTKKYDVAVIDLSMPEMSGDQIARLMRQADSRLAIVLVSGWILDQTDPRVNVFDFQIQKPIDNVENFLQVIDDAIQLHNSRG